MSQNPYQDELIRRLRKMMVGYVVCGFLIGYVLDLCMMYWALWY